MTPAIFNTILYYFSTQKIIKIQIDDLRFQIDETFPEYFGYNRWGNRGGNEPYPVLNALKAMALSSRDYLSIWKNHSIALNKIMHVYQHLKDDKGCQLYYRDFKRHRIGGPAVIDENGGEYYYINGKLSRTDGHPALMRIDGLSIWFLDGQIHRSDGPAIIDSGHAKHVMVYVERGKIHRDYGPAFIMSNHVEAWFFDGKILNIHYYEDLCYTMKSSKSDWKSYLDNMYMKRDFTPLSFFFYKK